MNDNSIYHNIMKKSILYELSTIQILREHTQRHSQYSFCLVSKQCLLSCRFEASRWPYECGMWWSFGNASQFARNAFSYLYGLECGYNQYQNRNEMKWYSLVYKINNVFQRTTFVKIPMVVDQNYDFQNLGLIIIKF